MKISREKTTEFYYRQLAIKYQVLVQSLIRITNPLYLTLKLEVEGTFHILYECPLVPVIRSKIFSMDQ